MSDSSSLSDPPQGPPLAVAIQLPVEAGVELPPQPNVPPSDYDICRAKLYEKQVEINYTRELVDDVQFASAIKYKAYIVAASDHNAAPPWFNQSMRTLLSPMRREIRKLNRKMYNSMNAKGDNVPFVQIPWEDGTYPWGLVYRNDPLPALTSVDVVEGLARHQSRKYFQGYCPDKEIPDDQGTRTAAILRAIGCVDPNRLRRR
ncbi:hypothetical protein BKA93DRAFT_362638 [Sparassis latifolia]